MGPVSLLFSKPRAARPVSCLANMGGMGPVSSLLASSKLNKVAPMLPMDAGICPVNLLKERSRRKTFVSIPSVEGKAPLKELEERSKTVRVGPKFPTREEDKEPLRWLTPRKRLVRLLNWKRELGRVPLREDSPK